MLHIVIMLLDGVECVEGDVLTFPFSNRDTNDHYYDYWSVEDNNSTSNFEKSFACLQHIALMRVR